MDRYIKDIYDGDDCWYRGKSLHREDGPAVIKKDGTKLWYKYDKLHREDGPAILYDVGATIWVINGKRHREDGPAYNNPLNGDQQWMKTQKITWPWDEETQALFLLTFLQY